MILSPRVLQNVPIPPKRRAGRRRIHRFDLLDVGDSLVIEATRQCARSCIRQFMKENPDVTLEMRILGEKTVQVWRVT